MADLLDLTQLIGASPEKWDVLGHYAGLLDCEDGLDLGGDHPFSSAGLAFVARPMARLLRTANMGPAALALGIDPVKPDPQDTNLLARAGLGSIVTRELDKLAGAGIDIAATRDAVRTAQEALGKAASIANASPRKPFTFRVDVGTNLPTTTVRPWITSRHQRGLVGLLVAEPAASKSTLMLGTMLAIATNRPDIIGEAKIERRGSTIMISNEDSLDEIMRRVKAAERAFSIAQSDRLNPMIFIAGTEPTVLVERIGKGPPQVTDGYRHVRQVLQELCDEGHPPAYLGVDTLASVTRGLDENDAADMQVAMSVLTQLARDFNIAVEVAHHTSKHAGGRAGDQSASRGSTAVAGAARLMHTLTGPAEDEVKRCGMTPMEAKRWVRLEGAKSSYSAISGPTWFRREGVSLPAVDPQAPGLVCTETAPILVPQLGGPKPTFRGLDRDAVLDFIRKGVGGDATVSYSPTRQAGSRSLHRALEVEFDLSPEVANALVRDMTDTGQLVEGTDRVDGKERKCVTVAAQSSTGTGSE